MEKGTFRVDANVSVATVDDDFVVDDYKKIPLGTKTELKNMNSFKAIKEALSYEIERQKELLSKGEKIVQQTRLWDENTSTTQPMRTKEEEHDYRYFPEPDLLPLIISSEWIEEIKQQLPELPSNKRLRFQQDYGLNEYDSKILTSEKAMAEFFDNTVKIYKQKYSPNDIKSIAKTIANLITTELLGRLNQENKTFTDIKITPEDLAELIKLYTDGVLSSKLLKEVFSYMYDTGKSPQEIVQEKNLVQITDIEELQKVVEEVINENPKIVQDYLSGKTQAISALIGQAMKKTKGKANPKQLQELFISILKSL
jgi:aspartyl-tRNA(Asn)/glutamyl-tRNA(Gln) amidotransferase subunit B